jgi:hypothetical protein
MPLSPWSSATCSPARRPGPDQRGGGTPPVMVADGEVSDTAFVFSVPLTEERLLRVL